MGPREIAQAYLLACRAGWIAWLDVRHAEHDQGFVTVRRPPFAGVTGPSEVRAKVDRGLGEIVAEVSREHPVHLARLLELIGDQVLAHPRQALEEVSRVLDRAPEHEPVVQVLVEVPQEVQREPVEEVPQVPSQEVSQVPANAVKEVSRAPAKMLSQVLAKEVTKVPKQAPVSTPATAPVGRRLIFIDGELVGDD